MTDMRLSKVAQETIKITKQEYYFINGKRFNLRHRSWSFSSFGDVKVYNSQRLKAIEEDEDEFFERCFYAREHCAFYLVDADSYAAAESLGNPLVMNFANAHVPGGGFLRGAKAQEEALCRASTLYASLSSPEAGEMYTYNNQHPSPIDSDYMLLSPNVCVFRDDQGNLLERPYNVAVFTIPAPNKNGRAREVDQNELDRIMKARLRKFLMTAARNGYSELVLGAWGCGAFGHDARRVAEYFYDLFFHDKFYEFFDTVIFAILHGHDKIQAFADVFGDKIEDCSGKLGDRMSSEEPAITRVGYLESSKPAPVCNHTVGIQHENIGYTQGVAFDGNPFEAELWKDGSVTVLCIIIPERKDFLPDSGNHHGEHEGSTDGNIISFGKKTEWYNHSVLSFGMVDRGYLDSINIADRYVTYLIDTGLFYFTDTVRNGVVRLLTDVEGNDLACILVTLTADGCVEARTHLKFRDFPGRPRKTNLKIVK